MNEKFIARIIADVFDFPCTIGFCEKDLHNSGEKQEWCDEHCGNSNPVECWMHYFQIKYEEKDLKAKVLDKPKDCPFCGGEAECSNSTCTVNGEFKWTVECMNCGVITSPYERKEDAIKAWNRRTEE